MATTVAGPKRPLLASFFRNRSTVLTSRRRPRGPGSLPVPTACPSSQRSPDRSLTGRWQWKAPLCFQSFLSPFLRTSLWSLDSLAQKFQACSKCHEATRVHGPHPPASLLFGQGSSWSGCGRWGGWGGSCFCSSPTVGGAPSGGRLLCAFLTSDGSVTLTQPPSSSGEGGGSQP